MALPKLTAKQQKFVFFYATNGNNASDAYRKSYDCSNMKDESINVEASKLLKNTKVTLWVQWYQQNTQNVINQEFEYSQIEHFNKLNELQTIALSSRDKQGNPNVSVALKAEELKGKMSGCYDKKVQQPNFNGFFIGDEE